MSLQKITLPIRGMHCRSCELLLEEKFSHVKHVEKSGVDYHKGCAEIYYSEQKPEDKELENAVRSSGYEIGAAEETVYFSRNPRDYKELFWAAITVFFGYKLLKAIGVTELVNFAANTDQASYGLVILLGLVAGFSSCMALIGGLVLGLSAKHAEKHPEATASQKFRPHLYFNMGRIGGYALLGGILGTIGSVFKLSASVTGFLTLFASAVMLFVGLQLIDIFPRLNSWKLTLPKGIAKFFGTTRHHAEYNHRNSMIVGALTFFIPCGFTQAMQVYAVSTGSFVSGAAIMGLFAMGTAPGLLSIGGITSALKGAAAKKFFKIAGIVVILFALFNISNSLTLAGINWQGNSAVSGADYQDPNVKLVNGVQEIRMTEGYSGYSPNKFTIKKGVPVKWIINARAPYSCASSLVVPKLRISRNLEPGENIIEFTPKEAGKITFSCSMGMYTGVFNVVEKDGKTSAAPADNNFQVASAGASCGGGGGGCGGCGGGRPAQINTKTTPPADAAYIGSDNTATQPEQIIKAIYTLNNDIQPNNFSVKAGEPVKFLIDAKEDGQGCMASILIPGLYDEPLYLQSGSILEMDFTPKEKGRYLITCAMGVPRGVINVE